MRSKTKRKTQKQTAIPSHKQLTELIEFCRANGVLKVEMGDIKLEIAPLAVQPVNYDDGKPMEAKDTYSDEEILMWSANGQGY